jgi:Flp pilus assembly protein TadD
MVPLLSRPAPQDAYLSSLVYVMMSTLFKPWCDPPNPMRKNLMTLALAAVLSACTTAEPRSDRDPSPAEAPAREAAVAAGSKLAEAPTASKRSEGAIPDDALLPLLSAEFALRRREFDYALAEYMRQSERLRDLGVVKHTAQVAQFMNRTAEAGLIAQWWLELEPDDAEANSLAAHVALQSGRPLNALPHLAAIARSGEQASFAMLVRSYETMDDEGQQALLAGFEQLQREFPNDVQLMMGRAMMLEYREEPAAALAAVRQVFEQEPQQQQALVLEARLLQNQGAGDEAFDRLRSALDADPENTNLRLQYARMLTRDDMTAAREEFQKLVESNPGDADLTYSLALIQRELGDDEAARRLLRPLLRAGDERSSDAHYQLGRIAEDAEQYQEAAAHYAAVIEGRDFAAAHARLGRLLLANGESEQFALHFARLRRDYPNNVEQIFAIEAEVLVQAKQLSAALAVLDESLEQLPESTMLRYTRSTVHQRNQNVAAMERDLRSIIENDPDNAMALNALGYTLTDLTDRHAEAEVLIRRAHELQPDDPAILDSLGWVKYRLGDLEAALGYLRRAYAAFPDPEVAAHLGEVLWTAGEREEARAIWREGAERDADHEVLRATLERFGIEPESLLP